VKTDAGWKAVYTVESPEIWFEDFGSVELSGGRMHVELDPLFLQTVTVNSQHPMKVFVTQTSGEPVAVVVNKGTTGFDLASTNGASASFDYRIIAKRKGYEDKRLDAAPSPDEVRGSAEAPTPVKQYGNN
jgi:hypothetical protein